MRLELLNQMAEKKDMKLEILYLLELKKILKKKDYNKCDFAGTNLDGMQNMGKFVKLTFIETIWRH